MDILFEDLFDRLFFENDRDTGVVCGSPDFKRDNGPSPILLIGSVREEIATFPQALTNDSIRQFQPGLEMEGLIEADNSPEMEKKVFSLGIGCDDVDPAVLDVDHAPELVEPEMRQGR